MCYSPLRRDLFVLWGGWGERKRERTGHDGKGEGEERPLPHNVRFTGRICGSVVLAKPADYLDAFEDCCKDNAFSLVPSSIVPRALSIFFYYCYFYRDIQREPRRRREWPGCFKSMLDYVIFHPQNTKNPSCVGARCAFW